MRLAALCLATALAAAPVPSGADAPGPALPFLSAIEVAFDLTDHDGRRVTEADFRGRPVALFFGYANCESICSVALPRMGAALDLLGEEGARIAALMVTVDPEHDTPGAMKAGLARHHPRLVGLTGSEAALAAVRERFRVEVSKVAEDPTGAPIYAHGGFVYLIDAEGRVQTALPPILGPERMAELMRKYL